MNHVKGLTLIESMVAVAVVGVIATIALPGYQYFIGKSQASEAVTVITHEKTKLASALKLNRCTASGADETIQTKFGTLTIGGTYKAVKGENCPVGCTMTYTFNNDVKKSLKGKVVKVDVLKNLKLHQHAGTTIAAKYLPANFTTSKVDTGAVCTDLKGNVGTITDGSVSAIEVGDLDPSIPVTPPEPPAGGDPSNPPAGGNPSTPVTPPGENPSVENSGGGESSETETLPDFMVSGTLVVGEVIASQHIPEDSETLKTLEFGYSIRSRIRGQAIGTLSFTADDYAKMGFNIHSFSGESYSYILHWSGNAETASSVGQPSLSIIPNTTNKYHPSLYVKLGSHAVTEYKRSGTTNYYYDADRRLGKNEIGVTFLLNTNRSFALTISNKPF